MRVSFAEDGRKDGQMPEQPAVVASAPASSSALDKERRESNLNRLQEIITKVLEGTLPRERELKSWEPQKLSSPVVSAILDHLQGMSVRDAAEKAGLHYAYLLTMLKHPDAIFLRSTVLGLVAEKLTDPLERVKMMTGEALSIKAELMRTAKSEQVRDKAATDILALAGYGGKNTNVNINSNNKNTLVMPREVGIALAAAMAMSKSEDHSDYHKFIASGQKGDEILAEHRQLSEGLPVDPGQIVSESGASPIPSPEQESSPEMQEALADEKEAQAARRLRRIA